MDGKQLKNSILQWAIQGKLVPQNPKDEPASKLLERIAASRNENTLSLPKGAACHPERNAVKSKDLKKKKASPISRIYRENGIWYEQVGNAEPKDISEDIPFEIPENWAWCRIGDIFYHASGKQQSSSNKGGGTPQKFITTSNLYWGRFVLDNVKVMNFTDYEIKNCSATKGDLLVCEGGAGYGRSAIWDKDYDICLQNHIHRLRPCINGLCEYVYYYIYLLKETNRLASVGTAMPGLSANRLKDLILPLPPLAEQKRIVAKLEQVLPLADEYGAAQEELDKLNKGLPEALKKSILQQAIQGKLVPQNPKDEPAQKLLERITSSRHSERSEESSKRSKKTSKTPTSRIYRENGIWHEQIGNAEPKDISDEIPFEIPETWAWCRLDCLGTFVRGNGIKRDETIPTGKPCVRYGEMYTTYKVKFSEVKSFTKKDIFDKCHKIHKDDILMALTGENKWDIALAATYQGDDEVAIGGDLCKFTPIECNPLYLVYLINSPYGIGYKREASTGDIIVHTSVGKLGNFLVPLPPLAEQKRIVTKLEQLIKVI